MVLSWYFSLEWVARASGCLACLLAFALCWLFHHKRAQNSCITLHTLFVLVLLSCDAVAHAIRSPSTNAFFFYVYVCVCALGGKINILEHTLWRESCWYAQQSAVTPAAPAALWWVVRADKHRHAHIYYIHLYTSIYTCISLPFGFLAFQLKFDTYNPLYLCVCELAARCHALPTFPPAPTQRHIQW